MAVDDPARPIDDADRRRAISELRQAAEDGRLGPKELDARLARVHEARLVGELAAALDDLPPAGRSGPWPVSPQAGTQGAVSPPPPVQQPRFPQAAGYRPDDRLSLSAGMSREKRDGVWEIPPYLRVQAGMSTVKLDCRQAIATTDVIDIEVGMGMSSIVLVLPEGWGVNVDRLGKGMGTIKIKIPTTQAAAGQPTLVLHGQLGAGTLVARHANWIERR